MQLRYIDKNKGNKTYSLHGKEYRLYDSQEYQEAKKEKLFSFGDIGKKGKKSCGVLEEEDKNTCVYSEREKIGFFEKVYGYLPCVDEDGQEGFVRIVKSAKEKMAAVVVVLLILVGGGAYFFLSQQNKPNLDPSAIAYQMPNGLKNEDPNQISLPGYSILEYKISEGKVKVPLINPEGNRCYFKYTLTLKDTGEVLYQSGLIKPGNAIPEFKLEKEMKPGEYDVVVQASTWDLNNHKVPLNGGSIEAQLKVAP